MLASASGELYTRSLPNLRWRPQVTLNTPPFPLTLLKAASREASATSWPKTMIRGSRAISSLRHPLSRSTMVVGSPENCGSSSVSNCSLVGSASGEKTCRVTVSAAGCGEASASSAARFTSSSTPALISALSPPRLDLLRLGLGGEPLGQEAGRKRRHRVAGGVGLAFLGRPIQHLIVRQRVRVGANHAGMRQRRSPPRANVRHGAAHHLVRGDQIAPLH